MEQVVESFVSSEEINSLASVALQNRRALDLFTTEGTCLFLGEDCCSFVNETGLIQERVREFRDRIKHHKKGYKIFPLPKACSNWPSLGLLPPLGPLVLFILLLLFGPCFFNLF